MEKNNFTLFSASQKIGVSKRQFSRFLSGETSAKRVHALAMQMVWLIQENKKKWMKIQTRNISKGVIKKLRFQSNDIY